MGISEVAVNLMSLSVAAANVKVADPVLLPRSAVWRDTSQNGSGVASWYCSITKHRHTDSRSPKMTLGFSTVGPKREAMFVQNTHHEIGTSMFEQSRVRIVERKTSYQPKSCIVEKNVPNQHAKKHSNCMKDVNFIFGVFTFLVEGGSPVTELIC